MRRRLGPALAICGLALALLGGASASSPSSGSALPPPTFRPSAAWLTVTTGSSNIPNLEASVWAITARSNLAALAPYDLFNGLRHLSRGAVLVWASTAGRGGPNVTFGRSAWPLPLSTFRVDRSWEGQPASNVQQRLRWAAVHGWHLDVRVYFATQHPGKRLLRTAQQELDRLRLPGG